MDNVWKHKNELKTEKCFRKYEKEYDIEFSKELKQFIIDYNGAIPSKYNFLIGKVEKILGAVLSFNIKDVDVDKFSTAIEAISIEGIIPFAIDPFGNYICYSMQNNTVVFWEHENDNVLYVAKDLDSFLDSLY